MNRKNQEFNENFSAALNWLRTLKNLSAAKVGKIMDLSRGFFGDKVWRAGG